jgi:hypothetical protein
MSESLAIGERLRAAFVLRHGEEEARARFRNFDTICSATQERQDAVAELLVEPLDVMIIVGGFNSSNTNHLVEMCEGVVPGFHIQDEMSILDARRISHKPATRQGTLNRRRVASRRRHRRGDHRRGLDAEQPGRLRHESFVRGVGPKYPVPQVRSRISAVLNAAGFVAPPPNTARVCVVVAPRQRRPVLAEIRNLTYGTGY